MVKFTVDHQISCNIQTYQSLYKSSEFNTQLYKTVLGIGAVNLVEQSENDKEIIRKSSGVPTSDLPEPIAGFIGNAFNYKVDSRFDKATNTWTFNWIPNMNADKLTLQGSVKLTPQGEGAVKCTADFMFKADVFPIGGAIELFVQHQFTEAWKTGAAFANKWLADGKAIA